MPFTFSDDLTNSLLDYLDRLGPLSLVMMLKRDMMRELQAQANERQQRGLMPNGDPRQAASAATPVPIEQALPPGVKLAGAPENLNRQQRRQLAKKIASGEVKVNGTSPPAAQETPATA